MVTMQNAREKTEMEAESLFTEYERKASDFSGWKSYYSIGISPNKLFQIAQAMRRQLVSPLSLSISKRDVNRRL